MTTAFENGNFCIDENGNIITCDLTNKKGCEALNDETAIVILENTAGFGTISIGESDGICNFRWESNNIIHLDTTIGDIFSSTDIDGKFCIYDNGRNVALKNRLGSRKTCRFVLNY